MVAGIKQGERPHVGLLSSFHRKGQGVIVGFEHDEKPSGDLLSLTGKVEMWSLWSIRVKPRMGLLLSTEKAKLWSLRSKLERGVKPGVGLPAAWKRHGREDGRVESKENKTTAWHPIYG